MDKKNDITTISSFLKKNKILFEIKIGKILDGDSEKNITSFVWHSKDRIKKKSNIINFSNDGEILMDLIPVKDSNLQYLKRDKRIFKNFKMGEKKLFSSYGYNSDLLDIFYQKALGDFYDIIFKK